MSNAHKKTHLRLVPNVDDILILKPNIVSDSVRETQLSFSFSDVFRFIFIREADILKGADFLELLVTVRPCYLFDVRLAPRLDFVASNRLMAFKAFRENCVDYVDIIGTLGLDSHLSGCSMPEFWLGLVGEKMASFQGSTRNAVFIFDNDEVLNRSKNMLPSYIKSSFSDSIVEIISDFEKTLIAM